VGKQARRAANTLSEIAAERAQRYLSIGHLISNLITVSLIAWKYCTAPANFPSSGIGSAQTREVSAGISSGKGQANKMS